MTVVATWGVHLRQVTDGQTWIVQRGWSYDGRWRDELTSSDDEHAREQWRDTIGREIRGRYL